MSCEHLICAACGGMVEEARCPACRAARAHVHRHGLATLPPAAIAVIIAVLALALMLVATGH